MIKALGLIALPAGLTGCLGFSYSWNQKLTVTVATPNGEKSGSAVVQINVEKSDLFGLGNPYTFTPKGEATVVDLGQGKYLFALLENNRTEYLANAVFTRANTLKKGDNVLARLSSSDMIGAKAKVDLDLYPMLVTFDDVKDPKTVKEVKSDDLAAAFGSGYSLKSITLEITDEPVTEGVVEKVLPWIGAHRGRIKKIPDPTPKNYIPPRVEEIYRDAFIAKDYSKELVTKGKP